MRGEERKGTRMHAPSPAGGRFCGTERPNRARKGLVTRLRLALSGSPRQSYPAVCLAATLRRTPSRYLIAVRRASD